MIDELARRLEESAAVSALRELPWSYPALECLHLLGISLLLGGAFLFDLRLLGVFPSLPLPIARRTLLPAARVGFAVAGVAGLALFAVSATGYLDNPAFGVKMLALSAAGLNVTLFHAGAGRRDQPPRGAARGYAVASLALWTVTLVAGRLLGYL